MKSLNLFWVIALITVRLYGQSSAGKDSSHLEPVPDTTRIEYRGLFLKPVEITAIRAGDKTPFTQVTLGAGQIAKMNNGRDLPYILEQTPSVVASSDAGNGFGYTGISIRGTDASRINMTLNGLPYNDAESQAIYFVDL
ncbi:MAG TPA: Plug domain-containing protein, partial [Puia sp.]